ncbi:MAG: glycosyltransferase [Modestobacter sp.]|jgi:colanic acid biosynthesis glycosyl transferase WcaI|nr:glycosyltransferase [Modestobacter sp.]
MRVVVVSQYFWPEGFRVNDLVAGLVADGHRVDVLTGQPNYPAGRLFPGYGPLRPVRQSAFGARITRVPLIPRGNSTPARLAANYLSFAASASLLGPLLLRGRVDAVLVVGYSPLTVTIPAAVLGWVKRAPVVLWLQDLWPDTLRAMGLLRRPWLDRAATAASAWLHRRMERVLVQSEAFRGPLLAQGVRTEAISYAPNWAEEEFVPVSVPEDAPERAEVPQGFVLMFAGNLGSAQGLETLVQAAEATRGLPDLHWVVLGDGSRAGWLADEVRKRDLGRTVHLPGRRTAESMPTWFALADVMVVTLQPAPVFALTIPSKVQAYLACGRPVLAALDGEGARVVRASGCGVTVDAGDGEALAAGARHLYGLGVDERAELGRRARRYYSAEFDRRKTVRHIADVLVDVAQKAEVTACA